MTDPADEDTARVPRPGRRDSGDDGSTVVARRESRRRQERAGADRAPGPDDAAVGAASSHGRVARTPDSSPAVESVRAPEPVVVARTPREAREPQTPVDTVAAEASRRRRTRRITAIVVAAASVVIVLAGVALVILVIVG